MCQYLYLVDVFSFSAVLYFVLMYLVDTSYLANLFHAPSFWFASQRISFHLSSFCYAANLHQYNFHYTSPRTKCPIIPEKTITCTIHHRNQSLQPCLHPTPHSSYSSIQYPRHVVQHRKLQNADITSWHYGHQAMSEIRPPNVTFVPRPSMVVHR